ncbi:hypothetical protein P7K49_006432, partial [Saguinus oedipus]
LEAEDSEDEIVVHDRAVVAAKVGVVTLKDVDMVHSLVVAPIPRVVVPIEVVSVTGVKTVAAAVVAAMAGNVEPVFAEVIEAA